MQYLVYNLVDSRVIPQPSRVSGQAGKAGQAHESTTENKGMNPSCIADHSDRLPEQHPTAIYFPKKTEHPIS